MAVFRNRIRGLVWECLARAFSSFMIETPTNWTDAAAQPARRIALRLIEHTRLVLCLEDDRARIGVSRLKNLNQLTRVLVTRLGKQA